jgi:hypothetical protein
MFYLRLGLMISQHRQRRRKGTECQPKRVAIVRRNTLNKFKKSIKISGEKSKEQLQRESVKLNQLLESL